MSDTNEKVDILFKYYLSTGTIKPLEQIVNETYPGSSTVYASNIKSDSNLIPQLCPVSDISIYSETSDKFYSGYIGSGSGNIQIIFNTNTTTKINNIRENLDIFDENNYLVMISQMNPFKTGKFGIYQKETYKNISCKVTDSSYLQYPTNPYWNGYITTSIHRRK